MRGGVRGNERRRDREGDLMEPVTMGFNVEGCTRAVYHTQILGKEA